MIPEGMRDVLPPEAAELRAIEQIVLARFGAYGYGEVRPPALEYPETMERTGVPLLSSGFHLYDERGRALVLRTDLTTAICRLAVDRLRERPLPLRLAYEGPIYRTEASRSGSGRSRSRSTASRQMAVVRSVRKTSARPRSS